MDAFSDISIAKMRALQSIESYSAPPTYTFSTLLSSLESHSDGHDDVKESTISAESPKATMGLFITVNDGMDGAA